MSKTVGAVNRVHGFERAVEIARKRQGGRFTDALERALGSGELTRPTRAKPSATPEVAFSRHAQARLKSRGVELSDDELGKLSDALDKLQDRGARESLVLLGDHAFVVGVPKRTVITVMDRAAATGSVFTNIDSTFISP